MLQAIKGLPSPTFPATFANRKVRRADLFGRALPTEWDQFRTQRFQEFLTAIQQTYEVLRLGKRGGV